MFAKQVRYQIAIRLATKAWMLFMETGSPSTQRSYQRMMKLAQSLRVPAGPHRGKLWIDIQSIEEHAGKMGYLNSVVSASR